MGLRRIDYIEKYWSMCVEIRKKYPCINFDAFTEKYCKEFDETEVGTYSELTKKRHKFIDGLKARFNSYNYERERKLNNAKVWLKQIMLENSINKYSDDAIIQHTINNYLYKKADDESESLAECWNNLDKYNTIISDILNILKGRDKDV